MMTRRGSLAKQQYKLDQQGGVLSRFHIIIIIIIINIVIIITIVIIIIIAIIVILIAISDAVPTRSLAAVLNIISFLTSAHKGFTR